MGVSGILRICISDEVITIDHRDLTQKSWKVILVLYLLNFWSPPFLTGGGQLHFSNYYLIQLSGVERFLVFNQKMEAQSSMA